jgi:hypothetical protein
VAAAREQMHPVETIKLVKIMNHADHGHAVVGQAAQDFEDFQLGGRIEPGGDFIAEEHGGGGDELEREAQAAELAPAQLGDRLVEVRAKADAIQLAVKGGGIVAGPGKKIARVGQAFAHGE